MPNRTPAPRKRLLSALGLLAALAACAPAPLGRFDSIAVARPVPASASVPPEGPARVAASLLSAAARGSRLALVSQKAGLSSRTVVVHSRLRSFEDPGEGRGGVAALDILFAHPSGRPVAYSSLLSLGRGGPPEMAAGRDFRGLLHALGGRSLHPAEEAADPAGALSALDLPPPPGPWVPARHPGRMPVRLRLDLTPLASVSAGSGRGSPDFPDIFSPGVGAGLETGFAAAPGLEVSLGAWMGRFAGRRFESSGLVLRFDDLAVRRAGVGLRGTLPLAGGVPSGWFEAGGAFADTRGLLLVLSIQSGLAFFGPVSATVERDDSGLGTLFGPGERVPFFERGGAFFAEILAGPALRLGEGPGFYFSFALLGGLSYATPPKAAGPASESGPLKGIPLAVEAALHF